MAVLMASAYGAAGLRRGGMRAGTVAELYKLASINLCPNTIGQIAVGLMCKEPEGGSESSKSHQGEKVRHFATSTSWSNCAVDWCVVSKSACGANASRLGGIPRNEYICGANRHL
jgi:hypothetical protein